MWRKEESVAVRYFVGQGDHAFAMVQQGLESRFAPSELLSMRELTVHRLTRWLVVRYRAAHRAAAASAPVAA